jgi:transposase-like protein
LEAFILSLFPKLHFLPVFWAQVRRQELEAFIQKWDNKYNYYIGASWKDNWQELSTFWRYPYEMRRLIYTTNPIFLHAQNYQKQRDISNN